MVTYTVFNLLYIFKTENFKNEFGSLKNNIICLVLKITNRIQYHSIIIMFNCCKVIYLSKVFIILLLTFNGIKI